jgi:radical SAM superfamily enzyme YgiQ (UPF0313 family)
LKKRILLINPWIYDFAAYDLWIKPLGLLYIASILRENGIQVDVIDCLDPFHPGLRPQGLKIPKRRSSGRGHFPKERIPKPEKLSMVKRHYHRFGISPGLLQEELLKLNRPDLILVTSMMTYWYPGLVDTIATVRRTIPDVAIILGGVYASLCTDHARAFSGADEVVSGAAEDRLGYIIGKYLNSELSDPPDAGDPDAIPYPAFDLLRHIDQIPIMMTRGCPFRCTYCASGILNPNGFRSRDPIRVADEIEYWYSRFGVRHFSFYDDALLVNSERSLIPALKEILRRGLDCSFHCPNGLHLREMTAELAGLMRMAGFKTLRFGFETTDTERQVATGGKATDTHLKTALRYLKEAGYALEEIGIYLLSGLPGQSASEINRSINFVKSLGARPILTEYSPLPGTAQWRDALVSTALDIANEPLYHNNTLLPCRDAGLTDEVYQELKQMTR